jgi:HEXXH motif-containing protein
LQGAYAHLGVADFWRTEVLADSRAERGPRAGEEYLRWRDHTLGATRILLDCGELTEAGEEFTQELALTIESWGSGGFAQMSDELTTGVSRTY